MNKDKIFNLLKEYILEIIPDLDEKDITLSVSLKDLGANSIERMDITMMLMEELELDIPRTELLIPRNLDGLVNVLSKSFAKV
ncbi:acyl carrier protein [Candidatus Marinamargulisbacteria bacterium SCGC AG-414-C22]|nr:acyl carrier protein [Candidatus Marinamargulisbacteria bacterium SCGC AG-414-C22]